MTEPEESAPERVIARIAVLVARQVSEELAEDISVVAEDEPWVREVTEEGEEFIEPERARELAEQVLGSVRWALDGAGVDHV